MPALENIVLPGFVAVARQEGESLEVALQGELDMAAAFRLEPELERWLKAHEARRLVLDLAELTFVDSAGLGALLSIRDRADDLGIEMVLDPLSDPVRRIVDASGLGPVLLD